MSAGFGKPKYGGGNFTKSLRLKEGVLEARILPPMHSLAESGEWAKYMGTHFGYKGTNPKDPTKPTYRTFRCIEEKDFKTKMVTQDCPECDNIAAQEKVLEDATAAAKTQGATEDEIKEMVKPFKDWLDEHNRDSKWHMNIKTMGGEFASLQLSHKTKKLLEKKIQDLLAEEGIDALDLEQGVYFKFTRTGKGIDTQDTVEVVTEAVKDEKTGRISRTTKLAPLTEAEQKQALKECQDLTTLVRELTYQQIKMLTQCSGDPEEVDKILSLGQAEKKPEAPKAAAAPAPMAKPVEAPKKLLEKAEPDAAAQIAALQAQLAALQKPAEKPAPEPEKAEAASVAAVPASAPAETVAPALDRAAFMAKFKAPKA